MKNTSPHFIIVAGEASGDMQATHLVSEIRRLAPHARFSGLGGLKMRENGVEIYADLTRLALIGFLEVAKHYVEIKEIFHLILAKIKETRPDAVILVDYPGFNLRLAKEIKKLNIKVIYYISPQVWAWKANRVKTIKNYTDRLLVFFAFEKRFYAERGITVDFIGHPLLDMVTISDAPATVRRQLGLAEGNITFGILPGSRQKEISSLLPVMLKAARLLHQRFPSSQFVLVKAPTINTSVLIPYLDKLPFPLVVANEKPYDAINSCDFCLVASGTATLETAILNKPLVVIYKTSLVTWFLAKLLIKIPYIGLVNVVAGEKIVPECVQFDATPEKIAQVASDIMADPNQQKIMKQKLAAVKNALGEPGAARRAAEVILNRGQRPIF